MKPRFTRGTHTFDFPILLTQDYTNWRLVLGAYVVPPLTIYVAKRHIIRPLLRWRRLKEVIITELPRAQHIMSCLHPPCDISKHVRMCITKGETQSAVPCK